MRKYLLLLAMLFGTIASFANLSVKTLPSWDKPLVKKTFTDPTIFDYGVFKDLNTGNLVIYADLDTWTDNRTWRAVVGVNTYKRNGFSYSWTMIYYNLDFSPNSMNASGDFAIGPTWQYSGYTGGNNTFVLYDDQYYVSSWGPL